MMLLRSDADTEAVKLPGESDILAMDDYNQEMREARVLRSVEGLRSSADGTRVRLAAGGSTRSVTYGPFIGTKELIEIRTVFEPEDVEAVYLEQLSESA